MHRNERGGGVAGGTCVHHMWSLTIGKRWRRNLRWKSATEVIKHHQFNQRCSRQTKGRLRSKGKGKKQGGNWGKNCKVKLSSEPNRWGGRLPAYK